MRYAILADIHANLAAFTAVLEDVKGRGDVEEIWCLGDIVGYGPEPHQCIEVLRQHSGICVAGNHDWAAIGKIDTVDFNPDAAAAARWTAGQLGTEDRQYLEGLPLVIEKGDFMLVHGSPREPIWEYVLSNATACENFAFFKSQFCLVGHSHAPAVFREENGSCSLSEMLPGTDLRLGKARLIINPGGVGQPRDGDPRAAYAVYDGETTTMAFYRVPYDIAATQAKMLHAGLPVRLASRLSYGV